MPTALSLGVIFGVLTVAILASLRADKHDPTPDDPNIVEEVQARTAEDES
jgi:hypothetical protein